MSQEYLEIVENLVAAWNRKDIDGFLAILHPDVQWHDRAGFPDAGVHRGRDEVERHLRQIAATVDVRWEIEEVFAAGDKVATCATLRGRGVESGTSFEDRVYAVAEIRNGQVFRRESYSTRAEAFKAAGLTL